MKQPTKSGNKKVSAKKDRSAAVHPTSAPHHHSPSHHSEHHEHKPPERRAHPRGDDIFTKIQDATEKVLREKKHLIKK
ncbi:MAG: hypothetical protein ROO76_19845 [Terriglobia bacterium]|jgi:hypothetical protein|nr:hypothetical protein [Terriglobia bacterium]